MEAAQEYIVLELDCWCVVYEGDDRAEAFVAAEDYTRGHGVTCGVFERQGVVAPVANVRWV